MNTPVANPQAPHQPFNGMWPLLGCLCICLWYSRSTSINDIGHTDITDALRTRGAPTVLAHEAAQQAHGRTAQNLARIFVIVHDQQINQWGRKAKAEMLLLIHQILIDNLPSQ